MKRDELQERTKKFALRVLELIDKVPNSIGGSATSVSANYRAACRARSRAEFASKLGTVAEESDESLHWLEMIRDGNFISSNRIAPLINEADELTAIFTCGRRSASRTQTSNFKLRTS